MINLFNKLNHLLNFKLNKELKEIYTSVAFRAFAFGLVGIFIPVYLYKLGYSINSILLFYIFYYISYIIFSLVVGKLVRRFGAKHMMFFSIPPVLVFFVLLTMLGEWRTPIYLVGFILGISSSFYWIGYHLEFAKFSDAKNRGKQVSIRNIFASVITIFAPAIGGVVIAMGGFIALFISVLLIFTISTIPLFLTRDIFPKKIIRYNKIFVGRSFRKDILPNAVGSMLGVAYADIWPLIIFLSFASEYQTLGVLFSASMFLGLIFTYIAGKLDDKKDVITILRLGGLVNAFVWIGRIFISGITSLFFIESLAGVTKPFWFVPLEHYFYERASKSKSVFEYVIFREIVGSLGAILFYLILMILGNIFFTPLLAALGAVALLFV